ncbi:hypothetical protein DFH06DRAFT_1347914 [Mycena polygramma]|nr:hypothetical protein DFH06DRAFT_1152692 [Mycena polygramma]KAJ7606773.1 hypothetical protein DFH06DRAFT_1347914 [Mycena polygramma]
MDDDDADIAQLAVLLANVSLPGDAPISRRRAPRSHRRRSQTPPPPYTQTAPGPAPITASSRPPTSPISSTVYSTPRTVPTTPRSQRISGNTSQRSEAAALSQGVPGALAVRQTKKRKPRKSCGGYAVFYGLIPGPYKDWSDAGPLVLGVPGSLCQGYRHYDTAVAAYEYARSKSWTRVCPSRDSPISTRLPRRSAAPAAIPQLPEPNYLDEPNPLRGDDEDADKWYIVYCGVTPGVYQSHLECSLNTVGLRRPVYDSVYGRDAAVALYLDALERGNVHVLQHDYSS